MSALGLTGRSRRLVVGISGSSAPQYGVAVLRALGRATCVETHLVLSTASHRTIELETDLAVSDVEALADVVYEPGDLAAAISSGSFLTMGMVVAPCSMRTLASIAHGLEDNLLTRAAGVTLKERRPLVLVPRETPLSLIHLRNMVAVTEAGATVLPPTPGFYHRPTSIEDLIDQTTGKVLDQLGIEHELFRRWTSPTSPTGPTSPDMP
jgi:polyprenyl P-hydroxybenzoate/phenylacrylic acid decarboxylase-like protein